MARPALTLLLWVALAPGAHSQELALPEGSRGVLIGSGGALHPFETVEGARERPVLSGAEHLWLWDDRRPPTRLTPSELPSWPPEEEASTLRVDLRGAPDEEPVFVIAAPAPMWLEVTEDLLPRFEVPASGSLAIPTWEREAWRLRAVGRTAGSLWLDVEPAQRTAVLHLHPSLDASPVALDGEEGEPLDGVRLRRVEWSGRGADRQAAVKTFWKSDEAGHWRLPALPRDELISLVAWGRAYHLPQTWEGRAEELPAAFELTPGAVVTGSFVDATTGEPVAGARVVAEWWLGGETRWYSRAAASSDAEGDWEIAGIVPGRAALVARPEGYVPFHFEGELPVGATDLGELELEPGASLQLRVVDDLSRAIPGAEVRALGGGPRITDSKGQAEVAPVSPSRVSTVSVSAARHLSAEVQLAPPLPELKEVALQRAFVVLGTLVDEWGGPLPGEVRIEEGSRFSTQAVEPDGDFELALEPRRELRLVFSAEAAVEHSLALEPGEPGETRDLGRIAMEAGWEIRGTLLAEADYAPVAGARVWTLRPTREGAALAWLLGRTIEARSDARGQFRLRGLERDAAELRVDATGFASTYLEVAPEGVEPWLDVGEVLLGAGREVRVLSDHPEAEGGTARVDLRGLWREADMLTAPIRGGVARVGGVPQGSALVTAMSESGHLICEETVVVPRGSGPFEVDCGSSQVRVYGTVRVGGREAGAGSLRWHPQGGPPLPGAIMTRSSPLGATTQTVVGQGRPEVGVEVDRFGEFVTRELRPGSWRVVWMAQGSSFSAPRDIEIPEVDSWRVDLDFPPTGVEGRVVDEGGEPVARAQVRALDRSAFALTDAAGEFRLTGLSPGRHLLEAIYRDLRSEPSEVVVEPHVDPGPVVLVLEEGANLTLTVEVLRGGGAPAAGSLVIVEIDGRESRLGTADAMGRLEVRAPRGTARWRAAALVDGSWALGDWRAMEGRDGRWVTVSAPSRPGQIVVTSDGDGYQMVEVLGAGDWSLSRLSALLGRPPMVSPGRPASLPGLPAGRYLIRLGTVAREVALDAGERVELHFE